MLQACRCLTLNRCFNTCLIQLTVPLMYIYFLLLTTPWAGMSPSHFTAEVIKATWGLEGPSRLPSQQGGSIWMPVSSTVATHKLYSGYPGPCPMLHTASWDFMPLVIHVQQRQRHLKTAISIIPGWPLCPALLSAHICPLPRDGVAAGPAHRKATWCLPFHFPIIIHTEQARKMAAQAIC